MLVLRLCTLNLDTFYLSSVICHRSGRRRAPAASSSRWMRPSARRCGWHQVRHHPERTSWTSRRPPYMSTYIILGVSTAELSLWSSAWTTPSRESWCQHRWISTMAASTSNKHTLASKHTYLHLGIRPSNVDLPVGTIYVAMLTVAESTIPGQATITSPMTMYLTGTKRHPYHAHGPEIPSIPKPTRYP